MKPFKKTFLYRNSLSVVFILFFLGAITAQAVFGWKQYVQDLAEEQAAPVGFADYLTSGHFISATFENFQSEFLQMFLYVVMTIFLRQVGSAESKDPDKMEEVDREPQPSPDAPGPVRAGGWRLAIYKHSLSIAFAFLFLISWSLHLFGSFRDFNEERIIKGQAALDLKAYLDEPRFWFETFQNWQSEFLSVASIVILTIFLRQQGSPESKPVDAPHAETGK
ncbi:MAG: hypothetical protein ABS46_14095 [Cytophagaceae bacterium SCN 52-12]|nr:MAG: hypothetical protein ABS46_14095 [Cytophagaceae bacterium SCN 52-12]